MSTEKSDRLKIDKNSLKDELENHTEDFVLDKLEEVLNNDDQFNEICTCHNCLLDMTSYTLNRIPAKYISSPQGTLHAKLIEFEQQVNVDIISVLTRAIKIISKNPRHDE